jgi:hypothetical protein
MGMTASAKLFGVLNLLKPEGITSRDLVNRVQRLVKPAKVGTQELSIQWRRAFCWCVLVLRRN